MSEEGSISFRHDRGFNRIAQLEAERDALRAEVERFRETYRLPDENHCDRCGQYMPLSLNGEKRIHGCNRTPPLDKLPPTIYACSICARHGACRWGCWGTKENPHEHAYMEPIHELIPRAREALGDRGSDPV